MLVVLGGTSVYAQCAATAPPGQFISFPLTAHVSQGGPTAPDGGVWQVITKVDGVQQQQASMSANPNQGSPNTTISGTVPNWSGTFEIDATYTWMLPPAGSNTIQCFYTQSQALQINGICPANSFSPGDPINVPFSASGGNTKQYAWNVTAPFIVTPQTGPNTSVQGNAPSTSTQFQVTLS